MKEKFTFQQKTKLLTKLFDADCNTEKKLQLRKKVSTDM